MCGVWKWLGPAIARTRGAAVSHSAMSQGGPVASAAVGANDVCDWANGLTGASPMKKPSTWRITSASQIPPVAIALGVALGLLSERIAAAGLLPHKRGDAAAEAGLRLGLVDAVPSDASWTTNIR
jgi:hypothetical protein